MQSKVNRIVFILTLCLYSFARNAYAFPPENCEYASAVAEASRRFAYDLYYTTVTTRRTGSSGNIFLAPTTVESSLAMIHAGAGGKTRRQIWQGLRTSGVSRRLSEDTAIPCMLAINNPTASTDDRGNLKAKDGETVFRTASRLYGERSFHFKRRFYNRTIELGQKMKSMSFATKPDSCRRRINHWVSNMTNDKIHRLFHKNDISSDTKLAIVAVVYFKAPWVSPFSPEDDLAPFTTSDNQEVMAEYMSNEDIYRCSLSEHLQAELLELPFESDRDNNIDASMIILLPTTSMEELENRLTDQNTQKALSNLLLSRKRRFRVIMPKFEISVDYDLKPILTEMGMSDMFDESRADLSEMARTKGLHVSAAMHKTYLKVDEVGVEAAGATGVSISLRTIPSYFRVNRAFITLIYNKITETVLFIGKINDPTATE